MSRSIFSCVVCMLVMSSIALAQPVTIVGVTAPQPQAGEGIGIAVDAEFLQESWSQTGSYSNVDISALLFGGLVNGVYLPTTGTVYLTSTALGAPLQHTFTFPDPTNRPSSVLLFAGLSLPPGTYSLTFATSSRFGGALSTTFDLNGSEQITLAQGVTLGFLEYASVSNLNLSNPPRSTFVVATPGYYGFVQVTGTPGIGPPVNKDQCKGDRWKVFTIPEKFKNQGDCVSFVNTGN